MPDRVIVYIDGFNLYYGLREKRWKWAYWLNLKGLAASLLKPRQALVHTHYFTAVVKSPDDKRRRQALYLDALATLSALTIHYGHYLADTVTCRQCAHQYVTHHEKMTDVNIAVQLMTDAFQDRFDRAIVISADSDLVSPVRAVRELFPKKHVVVAFPPERVSSELKRHASGYVNISRNVLVKSLLPDSVVQANGHRLQRPPEWR